MDIDDGLKELNFDDTAITEGSEIEEVVKIEDPEVRETFAKIDEFLADSSSGVLRERLASRTDEERGC